MQTQLFKSKTTKLKFSEVASQPPTKMVIAVQCNDQGGRAYFALNPVDWPAISPVIKIGEEVLRHSVICHPYFDIDCDLKSLTVTEIEHWKAPLVQNSEHPVTKLLAEVLDAIGLVLQEESLRPSCPFIYDSSTAEKLSYRIIFQDIAVKNPTFVAAIAKAAIDKLIRKGGSQTYLPATCIDLQVYNPNHNLRLPGQTKVKKAPFYP